MDDATWDATTRRIVETWGHVRAPLAWAEVGPYKEWFHFSVVAAELDLLVNFSATYDGNPNHAPAFRLTTLARVGGEWTGSVTTVSDVLVSWLPGRVGVRLGESQFSFDGTAYIVAVRAPDLGLDAHLRLRPRTSPSVVHNVELGVGPPLHWTLLPWLDADGEVGVRGRTFAVERAASYHDHNWGSFRWGGDFAWEWGYATVRSDTATWTVVFVRMGDRAGHRTYRQGVFLWRNHKQVLACRGGQVQFDREGCFRRQRVFGVPAVLAVAHPGAASTVPQTLEVNCEDADVTLRLAFCPDDVARVIVPHDGSSGSTVIFETLGSLHLEGAVRGEDVRATGRAVVEFLGG